MVLGAWPEQGFLTIFQMSALDAVGEVYFVQGSRTDRSRINRKVRRADMKNWLKYMRQEELQDLQFKLSQRPWTPPTEDQVDRMLKEIRAAQTERSKAPDVGELIRQAEILKDRKMEEMKFAEAAEFRDLIRVLKNTDVLEAVLKTNASGQAPAPNVSEG
jgi:hypothetical protein